jgi:hypothetical protein
MIYQDVVSNSISKVGWEKSSGLLGIIFKNNVEYYYMGVPFEEYEYLLGAESVGSYFSKNIQYKYFYKQIKKGN